MADKNTIVYGDRTITDIKRGSVYIGNALVGEELSIDTLSATVESRDTEYFPLVDCNGYPIYGKDDSAEQTTLTPLLDADGYQIYDVDGRAVYHQVKLGGHPIWARPRLDALDQYTYGAPLYYYHDGLLVGKFYVSEIRRTGRTLYDLEATSAIGLLDNVDHYGGIYQGETLSEVAADIIGSTVEYTVDPVYADLQVYGWLPIGTKRSNLHQLLFAMGLSLKKDTAGKIQLTVLANAAPKEIPSDQLYLGGSVTHRAPATGVRVTEHAYFPLPSSEETVLFDGAADVADMITPMGAAVSGILVEFSGPCHSLRAEGASILESGVNYAVLSNSLQATLYGKEYIHTERAVSRSVPAKGAQNVVTSKTCTLVNQFNVDSVADRLMAYCGVARSVQTDLVVSSQKPGDSVALTDPFGDRAEGYISSMDITMSAVLRAQAEIVTGYIPVAPSNAYTHVAVLTASGNFTVPANSTGKLRVVIVGGGDGGGIGEDGKPGGAGYTYTSNGFQGYSMGPYGEGGSPGTPGAGGKVLVVNLTAKPGDVISVAIGAGGTGQTATSAAAAGKPSTFGGYTSASGSTSEGVQDPLTGALYGTTGIPGIAGMRGGGTEPATDSTSRRDEVGTTGPNLTYLGKTYRAGARGTDYSESGYRPYGGWGGGPAAGANGLPGGNATSSRGGPGGTGATPVKAQTGSARGQGGQAGHGGGGGGGGGANSTSTSAATGSGGTGGKGGPGGDGAPGVILVYY